MNSFRARATTESFLSSISWMDIVFASDMYLLAFIDSRTFYLIPNSQTAVLSAALSMNIIFFVACFWINRTAFWGMTATLLFSIFFLFIFSRQFKTPLSGRTLAGYAPLLSICVFGSYAYFRGLSRAMKILFIASTVYLVTFLYLHFNVSSIAHRQLLSNNGSNSVLLKSHDTIQTLGGNESYRIYTSGIFLGIGLFYSFESIRRRFSWPLLAAFALFSYAFLAADFRFQLAAATLTIIFSLLPISATAKIRLSAILVGCVMLAILFSAALSLNPYNLVRGDITGMVRADEARLAIETFQKYTVFGTGLYSEADQLAKVYGSSFMALSDLGYLGELVQFGLVGYALLFASNMLVHLFAIRVQAAKQIDPRARAALADLCVFLGLMQILSPYMWEVGGAIMLALSIGYLKRYGPHNLIRRRTPRQTPLPDRIVMARPAR